MGPKVKAFAIHLAASLILALLSVVLVFGVWYPSPLHKAVAVGEIFLLLLLVDVVIGPLLTFIVYSPGKKSLRFDLGCIVVAQFLAFAYGLWAVAEGRPSWLVFNADRFDLVQVYEIDSRNINKAKEYYRSPGWLGPQWVAAQLPEPGEARNSITFEAILSGIDIAQRPELYRPLTDVAEAMRKNAHPLEELTQYNSPAAVAIERQRWPEADAYLPMMARVHPMTVLVNKKAATIVAIVDLDPWH